MTRDDIHKLIAGYATGTLTEAERQALFAAALDDQELFDELAREQELKDLLEEPGVRQRLIATLEPASPAPARHERWRDAWRGRWSWVASAATVGAIVLGVYLSEPSEPKRLAVSLPPPRPVSPAPFVPAPPENEPAPPLPAPAAVERARASVAPKLPPPAPQPQPAVDRVADAAPPPSREDVTVAQAPPPAAPAPVPAKAAQTETPKAEPVPAEQLAQLPPLQFAGGGGGRGGRGVQIGGATATSGLLAKIAVPFGFVYSVTAEGRLRIVPSVSGFLSVSAAGQVLISNRPLTAASTTEVPLPEGATSATVVFSAQQIADSILSIVKTPLNAPSGTISDPAPGATSRVDAVISLPPRQ